MTEYLVLFGSNIDAMENFSAVLQELEVEPRVELLDVSAVYESPAVLATGDVDMTRPHFANAAIVLRSHVDLRTLRHILRQTEARLGRERSDDRFADRAVDLDILAMHDGEEIQEVDAAVWQQAYAAVPSAEVAPSWTVGPSELPLSQVSAGYRRENTQIRRTK